MTMHTKAAVLWAVDEPLRLAEVELAPPGPREVLVRIEASGVCHSDWNAATGASATRLPAVLGHEGSGVVETVGDAVTTVSAGQQVLLTWLPACAACRACRQGRPVLCEVMRQQMAAGSLPGGGFRLSADGRRLHHYSYLSTFAGYVVVHERSCVPVPAGTDMDVAALVGCAVMTGIGAVINRARVRPGSAGVEPGSTVVVLGAGGVGLNCIQGCVLAGARQIVAADRLAAKRQAALRFGATHVIGSAAGDLAQAVAGLTDGLGADYVFVAAGAGSLIETGGALLRRGGSLVLVGLPPAGTRVSLDPLAIADGSLRVLGSKLGAARPQYDIPRLAGLYQAGRLRLDELISGRFPLDRINDAMASAKAGAQLRPVIVFPGACPSPAPP